jgi:hypothetical protein
VNGAEPLAASGGFQHAKHELAFVPDWLPGESLYGWCARLQSSWLGTTKDFGLYLFGRVHACRLRDLPHGMNRFQRASRGLLDPTEKILRERTVLGAYWPLIDGPMRRSVVDAACDTTGVGVAMALGLPASRLGARHPLRWCPECLRDAAARLEPATWLIEHQWPATWVCARHGCPLRQGRSDRAHWLRPGALPFEELEAVNAHENAALVLAARLAQRLARREWADQASLQINCIERMRILGIAASRSRLGAKRIDTWFARSAIGQWSRRHADQIQLPGGTWIRKLLRGRAVAHPTKWIVLWAALWEHEDADTAALAFDRACDGRLVCEGDVQVLLWPDGLEHTWSRWPPERVCAAFDEADTLQEVAKRLSASEGAAKAWLIDFPEFHDRWLASVRERRARLARTRIDAYLKANPTANRAALLKACNTDMNWLSRWNRFTWQRMLDRVPQAGGRQRQLFD